MRRAILPAIVVLAAFAACSTLQRHTTTPTVTPAFDGPTHAPRVAHDGMPGPPSDAVKVRVTRVVDGDTVVLDTISVGRIDHETLGRYARLIGINTPEIFGRTECFGRIAADFTRRTLANRSVLIDFDLDETDRYGRALVYIWLPDGTFFNGELAAQGYADQETVPPNVRYVDLFSRLVAQAREKNLGLWRSC
jgi:micrococcal nuclease